MKKPSFILIPVFFFFILMIFSCENQEVKRKKAEEKLKTEIQNSIQNYLHKQFEKDGIIVNEINIHSIDSLNPKIDSLFKQKSLFNEINHLSELIKIEESLSQVAMKKYKISSQLYGANDFLTEMDLDEAKKHLEEASNMIEIYTQKSNRYKEMDILLRKNTIDSTSHTGYSVLFKVKATKDKIISEDVDSVIFILDKDLRLLFPDPKGFSH